MSDVIETHYSPTQSLLRLAALAEEGADLLTEAGLTTNETVLVYRGMSGVSFATAVGLALNARSALSRDKQVGFAYIRKDNEESHGSDIEHLGQVGSWKNFVFIDDFISSGRTFRACRDKMIERFGQLKNVGEIGSWKCLTFKYGETKLAELSDLEYTWHAAPF